MSTNTGTTGTSATPGGVRATPPSPSTGGGEISLFEYYCTHFLIPEMIRENKTYVVMDNAKPHRRNVLRAISTNAQPGRVFFASFLSRATSTTNREDL